VSSQVFSSRELGLAFFGALLVQGAFVGLLVLAGDSRASTRKEDFLLPEEIPIAVQPVLDDRPLLKLGSKKTEKQRLPDMWRKREPIPVKRFEERSAPSEEALDDVDEIPESELADLEHEAPPEDAELIKEQELDLEDPEEPVDAPELTEEGAADGVEQGTETDPLKARQIDKYRIKIISWFDARFRPPVNSVPCDVLKKLSAGVSVRVGGDRRIASFSISSPSGNATFDAKVQSTLSALVGEQLPPPPPLYPDILGATVSPRLSGRGAACQVAAPPSTKAPAETPPAAPAPPATPAPEPSSPPG